MRNKEEQQLLAVQRGREGDKHDEYLAETHESDVSKKPIYADQVGLDENELGYMAAKEKRALRLLHREVNDIRMMRERTRVYYQKYKGTTEGAVQNLPEVEKLFFR